MSKTPWWDYVQTVTNGASGREIANTADFDPSSISRWKRGDPPRWDFVIKFARAYNRNVIEALVMADMITDEEAGLREVKVGVDDLTTEELLDEALRRIKAGERQDDK